MSGANPVTMVGSKLVMFSATLSPVRLESTNVGSSNMTAVIK